MLFSGGIDSGSVFLVLYHLLLQRGQSPARLKAFTLAVDGRAADLEQSAQFLDQLDLTMFLETIDVPVSALDYSEAIRVIEDYKPLDVQSATMALALCRGIRAALSRLEVPGRRRRRRREPEGLPDRGEPRADDPQRPQQPDAVSGRLGRARRSSTR